MAMEKPIIFICLLFATFSIAQAQLGLLGLIKIDGTIFCTANGNMGVNGISTPVFRNAVVQLRCGNSVISTATTNASGIFSILLDPLQFLLKTLLQSCNLTLVTPLSTCNATLPATGILVSTLQNLGTTVQGLLTITNLGPTGFGTIN